MPQYDSATVTGQITAQAWNGSTGGIVVMDVAGTRPSPAVASLSTLRASEAAAGASAVELGPTPIIAPGSPWAPMATRPKVWLVHPTICTTVPRNAGFGQWLS